MDCFGVFNGLFWGFLSSKTRAYKNVFKEQKDKDTWSTGNPHPLNPSVGLEFSIAPPIPTKRTHFIQSYQSQKPSAG